MRKKFLLIPFLVFISILTVFFYLLINNRDPSIIPSTLIDKKAPIIESKSLFSKKKFLSNNEFGGEIILINYFATWCKPCRNEHIFLRKLSSEDGIKIIGINYKDNNKKTLDWLKELGNPYSNVVIDRDGRIAIDWGVYGIPETFIVNSESVIKYRHVGPINNKIYKIIKKEIKKNK